MIPADTHILLNKPGSANAIGLIGLCCGGNGDGCDVYIALSIFLHMCIASRLIQWVLIRRPPDLI